MLCLLVFILALPVGARGGGGESYSRTKNTKTGSSAPPSSSRPSTGSSSRKQDTSTLKHDDSRYEVSPPVKSQPAKPSRPLTEKEKAASRAMWASFFRWLLGKWYWFAGLFLLYVYWGSVEKLFALLTGQGKPKIAPERAYVPSEEVSLSLPQPKGYAHARAVGVLRSADPSFSEAVLLDFGVLLFSCFHGSRGKAESSPGTLEAYFTPDVLQQRQTCKSVDSVVVGSILVVGAETDPYQPYSNIQLAIDGIYRENGRQWYRTEERWWLRRRTGVQSRTLEQVEQLACPKCGSPEPLINGQKCGYCGEVVNKGDFDWLVHRRQVVYREKLSATGGGGGEEVGLEVPTAKDPSVSRQLEALQARDPAFRWQRFVDRAKLVFHAVQEGWSLKRWERVRPFETDRVFRTHAMWMERFEKEGITNHLKDVEVLKVEAARACQDAYYDQITVRIFAQMKDYKTNRLGWAVEGSRWKKVRFSEYWTFIRQHTGKSRAELNSDNCPSCGAPLEVELDGCCRHCRANLARGQYDWVLSRIEQDECYQQ